MLHVSLTYPEEKTLRLQIEGNLDADHTVALQNVLDRARGTGITSLVLSCQGLKAADEAGIGLLRAVQLGGGRIEDLSWYLRWKLSHAPFTPLTNP